MVVTPDAPHGLFNRAVVLADGEHLGIEVLPSSAPLSLELDGQLHGHLHPGERIDVQARPNAAGVSRIDTGGFADRARRKLGIRDPAAGRLRLGRPRALNRISGVATSGSLSDS